MCKEVGALLIQGETVTFVRLIANNNIRLQVGALPDHTPVV